MAKLLFSTKLSFIILTALVLTNCNGRTSPNIGEVYLYKSEKGTFQVAKITDIKGDKIFVCIFTDTDIINVANYGNCLDYGLAYQDAYMTDEEKKDPLHSVSRYRQRLPDKPTSRFNPMKVKEFSEINPTYLKNSEVTDEDKKIANDYWIKNP